VYELLIEMLSDLELHCDVKDEDEMKKRKEKFKEIIQIHQDLLKFIDDLENFYKLTNLACLGSIIVQCVASLFALISIHWYIGAIIVAINITEIFMLCIFGALLEIMQERFREKIAEVHWTNKSKEERKTILFMLLSTEKMASFTYIIGTLNLDTFMTVNYFTAFPGYLGTLWSEVGGAKKEQYSHQ
jgi:hypothetical protein